MYTIGTYKESALSKYSVPEEIRQMKPKGTAVKVIKGNYYVYSHSQVKDPETGRWKTATGKLLGKIIPGVGYCPRIAASSLGRITCYCYGEYLLATFLAKDDFVSLKRLFNPDEAMQVFSLACVFAVEGYIGLGAAVDEYEHSLIARDYPALKFSRHILTGLISRMGLQDRMYDFQRECMKQASQVAVDGHVIATDSDESDLSYQGYKTRELKSEQMNLMVAMDVNARIPLATRVFPGYMVDKKDFTDFMGHVGDVSGKLFIMDSGFNSEENRKYLKDKKAEYLMPVPSGRSDCSAAFRARKGRMAQFIYTAGRNRSDIVEYRQTDKDDGTKTVFYRNLSEKERLSKAYLEGIEEGKPGYTQEKYDRQSCYFGTIVLETNSSKEPKELYSIYKSRWAIETYYDRLKNGMDFTELGLSDYGLIQGISFVMLLAGRIDACILEAARKVNMTRKELVRLMSGLKLLDKDKLVSIENMKKEHNAVAEKLGFSYDVNRKCLD